MSNSSQLYVTSDERFSHSPVTFPLGGEFNLKLSQTRAESVKRYLEQQGGIQSGRLTTLGLGFTQPVAPNLTPEGRALNRRVVFREAHAKSGPSQ